MSFILEALAKSEQARQHTIAAPRYSLVPGRDAPSGERSRLPYLFLGGLVVINAVLLHLWTGPVKPAVVAETGKTPAVRNEVLPTTRQALVPDIPTRPKVEEKPVALVVPPPGAAAVLRVPNRPVPAGAPAQLSPSEFPAIAVAGFIQDESAAGMVIVNDKLVHEGDEISPGLRLEKILPDGLVFDFKGHRFKR